MFCEKSTTFPGSANYSNKFFQNINPFLANVLILYPLKISENQRFSDVFRRYKMGTLVRNGLRNNSLVSSGFHMKSTSNKKCNSSLPLRTEIPKVKDKRKIRKQ